jgi:hypothetical protein
MSNSIAPDADVRLKSGTNHIANRAIRRGRITTLSPLMVEFRIIILGYNIFAIRLSQFEIPAYFMNYDATFFALKYIGKPSVDEFVAEIAKIKRFQLRFLPFMLGRLELISHHAILN